MHCQWIWEKVIRKIPTLCRAVWPLNPVKTLPVSFESVFVFESQSSLHFWKKSLLFSLCLKQQLSWHWSCWKANSKVHSNRRSDSTIQGWLHLAHLFNIFDKKTAFQSVILISYDLPLLELKFALILEKHKPSIPCFKPEKGYFTHQEVQQILQRIWDLEAKKTFSQFYGLPIAENYGVNPGRFILSSWVFVFQTNCLKSSLITWIDCFWRKSTQLARIWLRPESILVPGQSFLDFLYLFSQVVAQV